MERSHKIKKESLESKLKSLLNEHNTQKNPEKTKNKTCSRSYSPTSIPIRGNNNVQNQNKAIDNKTQKIEKVQKKLISSENSEKYKKTKFRDDEIFIDRLKNFDNLDELDKEIQKNKEKFDKIFKRKKKEDSDKKEKQKYKPGSVGEIKRLQKIEKINKIIDESNQMIGKKRYYYKNSSSNLYKPQEIYFDKNEKFCQYCLCMHLPGLHINPTKNNMINNNIFSI